MKQIIVQRTALVSLIVFGIFMNWLSTGFAQTRPIENLPKDVVNLTTVWTEIPKGPTTFMRSTAEQLWEVVRPDAHRVVRPDEPSVLALRYAF